MMDPADDCWDFSEMADNTSAGAATVPFSMPGSRSTLKRGMAPSAGNESDLAGAGSSGSSGWGMSLPKLPTGLSLPTSFSSMLGDTGSGEDEEGGGGANGPGTTANLLREIDSSSTSPLRRTDGDQANGVPNYISETKAVTDSPHHLQSQLEFQRSMISERDDRINELKAKLRILRRATKQLVKNQGSESGLSNAGANALEAARAKELESELKASKVVLLAKENKIREMREILEKANATLKEKEESQMLLVKKNIELQQDLYREKQFIKRYEHTRATLTQKPTVKSSLWTSALDVVTGKPKKDDDPEVLRVIGRLRERTQKLREAIRKKDETIAEIQRRYENILDRNRADRRAMMELEGTNKELEARCQAVISASAKQAAETERKHRQVVESLKQEQERIKARHKEDTHDLENEHADEIREFQARLNKQKHQMLGNQRRLTASFEIEKETLRAELKKAESEAQSTKQMLDTLREGFQTQKTADDAKLRIKEDNIQKLAADLSRVSKDLEDANSKIASLEEYLRVSEDDRKGMEKKLGEAETFSRQALALLKARRAAQAKKLEEKYQQEHLEVKTKLLESAKAEKDKFAAQKDDLEAEKSQLLAQFEVEKEELKQKYDAEKEDMKQRLDTEKGELEAEKERVIMELKAEKKKNLVELKAEKDKVIEDFKAEKTALEDEKAKLRDQVEATLKEKEEMERRLSETIEKSRESLAENKGSLEAEIERSQAKCRDAEAKLATSQKDLSEVLEKVEQLEGEIKQISDSLREAEAARDSAKAMAEQAVAESEAASATTKEAVQALQTRCEQLSKTSEAERDRASAAEKKLAKAEKKCLEYSSKIDDVNTKNAEMSEGLQRLSAEKAVLDDQMKSSQVRACQLQQESKELKNEVRELKEAKQRYEAQIKAMAKGDTAELSELAEKRETEYKRQLDTHVRELRESQEMVRDGEEALRRAREELETTERRLETEQENSTQLESKVQSLTLDLSNAKSKLSMFVSELEASANSLREKLRTQEIKLHDQEKRYEDTIRQLEDRLSDAEKKEEELLRQQKEVEDRFEAKWEEHMQIQRQKVSEMEGEIQKARISEQENARKHFDQQFKIEMGKMRERLIKEMKQGSGSLSNTERAQLMDMFQSETGRLSEEKQQLEKQLNNTRIKLDKTREALRKWKDKATRMNAGSDGAIVSVLSSSSSSSLDKPSSSAPAASSSLPPSNQSLLKGKFHATRNTHSAAPSLGNERKTKDDTRGDGEAKTKEISPEIAPREHNAPPKPQGPAEAQEAFASSSEQDGVSNELGKKAEEGKITKEEAKKRLIRLFRKYNPNKIRNVDKLLERYKGREAQLIAAVQNKYEGKAKGKNENGNGEGGWLGGISGSFGDAVGGINTAMTGGLGKMFTF